MFFLGDELYAATESNTIRRVDPDTLDTFKNGTRYSNYLAVSTGTAHPHSAPDGSVYNMGNSRDKSHSFYNIIKVKSVRDHTASTEGGVQENSPVGHK